MKLVFLLPFCLSVVSAQSPQVTNLASTVTANGGRLSWSSKNVIAADFPSPGYFQVYTMNPDGTGNTCITCVGSPGVGVLQQVILTTGVDNALPSSGTWTTTGGGGTGANGTFTASGGNLQTVTITSGGSGYSTNTSFPTFVPSSGSLGTSTVTFPVVSGGLHTGNPKWSRSGNFLVFMQQIGPSLGGALDFPGFPGEGAWNELFATDTLGHFWQLTNQVYTSQSVDVGGNASVGTTGCTLDGTRSVTFIGGGATINATGTVLVSGGSPSGAITRTNGGIGYTSAPISAQVTTCPSTTNISGATLTGSGGVIYPAFSWDGTKLAWGQRVQPGKYGAPTINPGTWELAIGTWAETGGIPSLSSINYYGPYQTGGGQQGYYEPHGWSLDNSTVFFMSQDLGPGTVGLSVTNIYSYNPSTSVLVNLTNNTVTNWNEYPTPLPASYGSNKLLYMLYPNSSTQFSCVSDYWVMNYDGTGKQQLTFFNTPGSSDFFQGAATYSSGWTNTSGNVWQVSAMFPPAWVYFNYATQGVPVVSTAAITAPGDWYWNSGVLYVYSTSNPATAFTSPGILGAPSACMDDMSWNPNNSGQLLAFPNYYAEERYTGPVTNQGPLWILNMADVAVINSVSSVAFPGGTLFPGTVMQ